MLCSKRDFRPLGQYRGLFSAQTCDDRVTVTVLVVATTCGGLAAPRVAGEPAPRKPCEMAWHHESESPGP